MATGAGVTYTYDGDGKRVSKSSGTLYWYSLSGDLRSETDSSGNLLFDQMYFAGRRLGWIGPTSIVFNYSDHLGSSRALTDVNGHPCYDADYYLFGAEKVITNSCSQHFKFADTLPAPSTSNC